MTTEPLFPSSRPDQMRGLVLVMTSQCNLRCSYCYQNTKGPGRMSWDTARSAVDVLLRSDEESLDLDFVGGEALLEFPLIEKVVRYTESSRPPGKEVGYWLSTNGLEVDDDVLGFLVRHDFHTQLSFDGVPGAQDFRGKNSFAKLDRLLRKWRKAYPAHYENRLTIAITVHPGNLTALPDSIDYFYEHAVSEITLAPVFNHVTAWEKHDIAILDACFAKIFESSLRHVRRTGRVPLTIFRRTGRTDPPRTHEARPMCGVMKGTKPVIDVTGQAHGCATFVDSYQRLSTRFLRERVEAMRLGEITEPGYADRLARYPRAVEDAQIFHGKDEKYSSYGKCGECEHIHTCSICPMSIGNIPGNTDPRRIPDFPCAYTLVSSRYRARFPARDDPADGEFGADFRRRMDTFQELVRARA